MAACPGTGAEALASFRERGLAEQSPIDLATAAIRERAMRRLAAADAGEPLLPTYAAAWAILALEAHGTDPGDLARLRRALASRQLADGRVPVDGRTPSCYWPTALAVLAWINSSEFEPGRRLATQFLLNTTGKHWQRRMGDAAAHDPSIRGWPWVAGTHSWVQPTSIAVIALKALGLGQHERVAEAVRMLMDRQLPSGGWNFGNTKVFNAQLRPYPEDTGYALAALAGSVPSHEVESSIGYLESLVSRVRTPASLSWMLMGLGAWRKRPGEAVQWIEESLDRQDRLGTYSIRLLAQLVVSLHAHSGLAAMFARKR